MTKADAPVVTIETVTPELAQQWLGLNLHNRSAREPNVARFAADMLAGDWPVSTGAIGFNTRGELIDGQHRCMACVISGVPFVTIVVRNLPDSAMDVIDTGAKRKLADVLTIRGEAHAAPLGAALPVCVVWDDGDEGLRRINDRPSHSACLTWLDEHPEIRADVADVEPLRRPPIFLTPRIMAPFSFRARQTAPDDLAAFLHGLLTGANLAEHDPILHLRRWAARIHSESAEVTVYQRMAMVIKAFNAWRNGDELTSLQFRTGERFPQIGGAPSPEAQRQRRSRQRRSEA